MLSVVSWSIYKWLHHFTSHIILPTIFLSVVVWRPEPHYNPWNPTNNLNRSLIKSPNKPTKTFNMPLNMPLNISLHHSLINISQHLSTKNPATTDLSTYHLSTYHLSTYHLSTCHLSTYHLSTYLSPHIDSSWPANFDLPNNVRLYQSVVFEELDQLNFCSGKGHIANQHKSFTCLSVNMFFWIQSTYVIWGKQVNTCMNHPQQQWSCQWKSFWRLK